MRWDLPPLTKTCAVQRNNERPRTNRPELVNFFGSNTPKSPLGESGKSRCLPVPQLVRSVLQLMLWDSSDRHRHGIDNSAKLFHGS